MNTRILIVIVLLLATPIACAMEITSVTLRSTVRVSAPGELTLGDIAQISGAQSDELRGVLIETPVRTGAWTTISADDIRKLLDADPRVRLGSVIVNGTESNITRRVSLKQRSISSKNSSDEHSKEPKIRDQVRQWLSKRFRADPNSIRVSYREGDAKHLDMPATDRMVEIAEVGSSSRLALRVTVYHGERIESSFTINAEIEIQRHAMIVRQDIQRGRVIEESMVLEQSRWFSPFEIPATKSQVLGLASKSRIRGGDVVMQDDIEQPIVIERGEIVSVRSVAGSFVANRRARALKDARDGELFELESLDRQSRFTARASGKGRAVVVQNNETGQEH